MYDNIGGKIKGLAIAVFILGTIAAAIEGIILAVADQILFGALVLILGPIAAWISSWLLYGFGEMFDMVCDIRQSIRQTPSKAQHHSQSESSKELEETTSFCDSNQTVRKMELIVCPTCGRKQTHTNTECWQCGTKFDSEVTK